MYDIYGYYGLKNGIRDNEDNIKGGYNYSGNAFSIYEKYFGTKNPFAVVKDGDRVNNEFSMFGNSFGGLYSLVSTQVEVLEVSLECTLEELYIGGVKDLIYKKKAINKDGRTTSTKNVSIKVEIFKGYDESTRILFPGLGNEEVGRPNGK